MTISPSRAPTAGGPTLPPTTFGPGGGGGGGGALGATARGPGIGGGAGGPEGTEVELGIGGGGGAGGVFVSGIDEVGGDMNGVSIRSTFGVVGDLLSSMAESGRVGGAIVPNSIEASCLALPPVSCSVSSSEESSVESTTDHSSSSGRTRDGRLPAGVEDGGGNALAALSCCAKRWKGFVEVSLVLEAAEEGA